MFPTCTPNDILHTISPGQDLVDRIKRLEARNRPAVAARPPLHSVLGNFTFVRVKGLGRFWPEAPSHLGLEMICDRMRRVLNGLAAAQSSCAFVLHGLSQQLYVYIGCPPKHADLTEALLASHFAGIQLEPTPVEIWVQALHDLPYCHLLTGIPTPLPISEDESKSDEQIDQLVRGLLYSGNWAFVVLANPLPSAHSEILVDQWAAAIEQAKLEFQQPGTPGEFSRLGQLFVELLELQFERARVGRTQGNWLVQAYVLGESSTPASVAVSVIAGDGSRPEPMRAIYCDPQYQWNWTREQTTWLNSHDLTGLIQLPLQEYAGYSVQTVVRFDVALPEPSSTGGVNMGWVQDVNQPTGQAFELDHDAFVGHVLIAGTTDSGKTNTTFHLLNELAKKDVPFMVIEPTKGEYRFLRGGAFPDLQLLTLGSLEAPVQLNPFYVPPKVPVQMHVDYLLSLFAASFVLYAPMPYVLEAALHEVYVDKGWDLAANVCWRDPSPSERAFPTLSDLVEKVEEVVDRLGYDARITLDVKAGLQARLNSLRIGSKGATLDTRAPLDMAKLLEGQVVIEMGSIGDDEQKAFMMGLLLMRLYEYYLALGVQVGDVRLKHITVIEEAHRLLQNVPQAQGGDFANPRGKAVETFSNIIAEMRGYGEGFVIVEQSPAKLTPDVLKNTNVKLAHRIISADDRETLARAMNLDERGQEVLVSLPKGQAILFCRGMDRPMRVRFVECKKRMTQGASRAPRPGTSARLPDVAGRLPSNPRVRREFARWLLSAVSAGDADVVSAARERLQAAIRAAVPMALRNPDMEGWVLAANIPYLADRLATQLGAFYGWPFADEEKFRHAIEALWADSGQAAFVQMLLRQGTAVVVRPFDGCSICPAACRYRLFAALALDTDGESTQAARVLERYAEQPTQAGLNQVALYARYLSERTIAPESPEAAGVALCAGIQAGHRLGWHGLTLVQFAEQLWQHLSQSLG